jgi:hypothetical protein
MPKITLLKKAKVVSSNGATVNIDDAILDRVVSASQSTTRASFPLVKGHPKHDDPQYGSVAFKSVQREGDAVVAELQVHDEAVANEIRSKKYTGHSLKFNTATGAIYHVGILGAKLPAIPDLPPIELSGDDDTDSISVVELADGRMPVVGMVLRKMRDKMIEDGMTAEEADKIIPADELGALESYQPEIPEWLYTEMDRLWSRMYEVSNKLTELQIANTPALSINDSDTMTLEELQRENERLRQEASAQKAENLRLVEEKELAELSAFVESPDVIKRITPARKAEVLQLLRNASVDVVELSTSEGEETIKTTPREMLKAFIKNMPEVVELGLTAETPPPAKNSEAEEMAEYVNARYKK